MKIGFWRNTDGNLRTAKAGLKPEQVAFLQSLQVGDTLILWDDSKDKPTDAFPDFKLAKGQNTPLTKY